MLCTRILEPHGHLHFSEIIPRQKFKPLLGLGFWISCWATGRLSDHFRPLPTTSDHFRPLPTTSDHSRPCVASFSHINIVLVLALNNHQITPCGGLGLLPFLVGLVWGNFSSFTVEVEEVVEIEVELEVEQKK